MRSPVRGWRKVSRRAWRHWPASSGKPLRTPPYTGSPSTGWPWAAMWTRIWWVRPVSSRHWRWVYPGYRARTVQWVTAGRPLRWFTAIFFRRRPGKLDLVTCAAVLGGILFFFVDSLSAGGMVGNVLALISGISYAGVFMMNDMPEGDAISSVFWGDVFSAVVGLPFVAMETDFSATAVVSVLILGVFQVALAYILLTIGLKTTPPVTASLVSGIEPVLNPILVAVFYHEMIGPTALVGAVIVVGSVVAYNVICGRREHKERVPAQGEKQQSC